MNRTPMNRTLTVDMARAIAVVVVTAALVAPASAQQTGGPVEIVEIYHLAVASGVPEVAVAVLADDLVVWDLGGRTYDRADYLDVGLAEEITRCSGRTMEVISQRAVGDDEVAAVTTRYRLVDAAGEPGPETVETLVLSRRGGEWLISHVQRSTVGGG